MQAGESSPYISNYSEGQISRHKYNKTLTPKVQNAYRAVNTFQLG